MTRPRGEKGRRQFKATSERAGWRVFPGEMDFESHCRRVAEGRTPPASMHPSARLSVKQGGLWFIPHYVRFVCGTDTRASRDFLSFLSPDSGPAPSLPPSSAAAVIYRFATRLKARDNKDPGESVPSTDADCRGIRSYIPGSLRGPDKTPYILGAKCLSKRRYSF